MAIVTNTIFRESCLLSLPAIGNSRTISSRHYVPSEPVKLHLSCCSTNCSVLLPSLSLRRRSRFASITTFVSWTSDWAAAKDLEQLEEEFEAETEGEDFYSGGEGAEDGLFEEREDGDYVEPDGDGDFEPAADGDFMELPDGAKLFVGNLPYDVDCDALAALFNKAGTVEVAEIIYNRDTERSRGFGFVTMSTVAEAEKAVEKFHNYDMSGRALTVNKAAAKGEKVEWAPRAVEPSFTAYVGSLPWNVDDGRLEQIFSEHGKVLRARVVLDRVTNRSRGFAFVKMASETELNDAVAALDGKSLDGRTIRVSVAENRPPRRY